MNIERAHPAKVVLSSVSNEVIREHLRKRGVCQYYLACTNSTLCLPGTLGVNHSRETCNFC